MPDEVQPIKEVAALRKLADTTVYAMRLAGELPDLKLHAPWRIERGGLYASIDTQSHGGDGGGCGE